MLRWSYSIGVTLVAGAVGLGCSAQGDQEDNGLGAKGGGGNSGTGGIPTTGGVSGASNGGSGGTIIMTGGTGAGAASGTGGTQGGIVCEGQGTRLKGRLRDFQPAVLDKDAQVFLQLGLT